MLSELLDNGYSASDINDLCELYETQINVFIELVYNFDNDKLIKELHKLKGGAGILKLDDCVMIIDKLEKKAKGPQKEITFNREIIKKLKDVLIQVKALKQNAISAL